MNFELIDEFRRRTNASYDEAKHYLERTNGDLLDAVIAYEREKTGYGNQKNNTNQRAHRGGRLLNALIRVVQKLIDVKLAVTDGAELTIHIPLILLLLFGFAWHILLLAAIFMLILGYKFRFVEISDPNVNVAAFIERIKSKRWENN